MRVYSWIGGDRPADVAEAVKAQVAAGFTAVKMNAGLGIEINEKMVREAAKVGHDWKNPVWRNMDGTMAEW